MWSTVHAHKAAGQTNARPTSGSSACTGPVWFPILNAVLLWAAELIKAHGAARVKGAVTRPELAALHSLVAGLAADNAMAVTVAVEDALADAGMAI